ncbi:methyl-viologen-reducing hydrogenase subunit delta [ANME-1 cluster archaeon AG-394-G21]|nr:methyl-viologen-reducing hydrogenase subunit delta [ANME-1 cluster archaeon AG-394-G21]NAT10640.1 methyl-viologen-reducing hydrogenase subunit delta [ANME-1 cluster archaeon AG-394-G06]
MDEVKLIGFMCNWCCYAGADLAGVSRFHYPPNIRIIRVMCSGRVDPELILDTFLYGADGVFIGGCHLGECHYLEGNYYAEKKIEMAKRLLKAAGVEPERLRLEWVSASEGERFAEVIRVFTEEIKELGPVKCEKEELEAACIAAADYKLRILATKERELLEDGNKYGEVFTMHEMDRLLGDMVQEDYESKRILLKLKKPMSVKEIASELNLKPNVVFRRILDLKRHELIEIHEIRDNTPTYIANTREGVE